MSLNKGIEHNKEYRKPYYGSKSFDRTCRNHGGCPWCEENRKKKYIIKKIATQDRMDEYDFSNSSS